MDFNNNPNYGKSYVIKPQKGLIKFDFAEIWRFRELFYIFIWRDIKVRYKQTAIGVLWAILQPLFTMIIFTVFFGRLAKIPSDNVPYSIFVFTGLIFWNYFSLTLANVSSVLVEYESIIKKIYFPRLILPLSSVFTPIVDFFIALIVLIALMLYYHYPPTFVGIILVPFLVLISAFSVVGLGLFLASVNVKYRDVRYVVPFFIQLMLFLTPVIYPVSIIPSKFQWLVFLNPIAGVITLARSSMLHTALVDWRLLALSFGISLILLMFGLYYFRKTERFFADIL